MIPKIEGKIICKVTHGSRLYKMHGEDSDYDMKGCYLPNNESLRLMRAAKNYTWKEGDNQENEIFALTEFFRHAARGEGYAIDMLHCSDSDVIESSELWEYLRVNKSKFYTKDMVGLLGFTKTMAVKYSLKAERLNAVKKVLEILKNAEQKGVAKLFQMWDDFPRDVEHIYFGDDARNNQKDNRFLEVASKKFPATIAVSYAIPILENLITNYGDRVKLAAEMDEKETKSLSHSYRTGYQLLHIYKDGGFSYPLPENDFLMAVKYRKLDYKLDELDSKLNDLVTEVESLASQSTYSERVSQKWLDELVLAQYAL